MAQIQDREEWRTVVIDPDIPGVRVVVGYNIAFDNWLAHSYVMRPNAMGEERAGHISESSTMQGAIDKAFAMGKQALEGR